MELTHTGKKPKEQNKLQTTPILSSETVLKLGVWHLENSSQNCVKYSLVQLALCYQLQGTLQLQKPHF